MKYRFIDSIITLSNVPVTFNREQLRSYRNNELSLTEIKFDNKIALAILSDENLKRTFVFLLACTISVLKNTVVYAASPDVDKLGNRLLVEVRKYGKWVLIISGLVHMGKAGVSSSDKKDVVKIGLAYVGLYALLILFPAMFDWVEEAFEVQ